jgi:putative phage-type endonuclease
MQIIKNIEQTSDEWFDLRALRMTASEATAISNAGAGLETYIYNKMAEYYAINKPERYENDDLKRGREREPQARFIYENTTNCTVEDVCFIIKDDFVGCSPDGLVGDDGLVEFKAPRDINYFKLLLEYKTSGSFKIDTNYIWQMQMQMEVSERKWCDYVVYNPNYTPSILKQRVYADDHYFEKLRNGYKKGKDLILKIKGEYESKT